MRPDWTETWLQMAETIGRRSRCEGRKIGAVIVNRENRLVSLGYAGPPAGLPIGSDDTCSTFCPRRQRGESGYENCVTIHAEANSLMFADRAHVVGGTIYVNAPPCFGCAKLIANSGLWGVTFYQDETDSERSVNLMHQSGLKVEAIE